MLDLEINEPEGSQNEQYKVLARKYRPSTFSQMVGQDPLVQTIRNAIIENRVHHAYLLTGIRGTGKTSTARIIAKALNCLNPVDNYEPCNVCDNCKAIIADRHQDVIEIDAASNTSVDNIRDIIESTRFKPVHAKYKIFIIDEVHMLSKSAFNALLKTLEEPPQHVKFIFATTEIRKLPITIVSRCQRFDLRRITIEDIKNYFQSVVCPSEGVEADDESLNLIAANANGSMRDGLSILDQAISLCQKKLQLTVIEEMLGVSAKTPLLELLVLLAEGKIPQSLNLLSNLYEAGSDPSLILQDLAGYIHKISKIKVLKLKKDNYLSEAEWRICHDLAQKLDLIYLSRIWQMLNKALQDISMSEAPFRELEMALIRLSIVALESSPEEIILQLEKNNSNHNISSNSNLSPRLDTTSPISSTGEVQDDAINHTNIKKKPL